jgi:outer membrane lipoprotein carrier protein
VQLERKGDSMLSRRLVVLGVSLGALSLLLATRGDHASAQDRARPDARTVATEVQAFYDRTRNVEADFVQTFYNRLYDRYDRSRGHMVFSKPGRMRFDYARPNGKVIVSNGTTLTYWEPADTRAGQFYEQPMSADAIPGAFSFLTGEGRLTEDFRVALLSSRAFGWRGHVLELRPRTADPRYERVLLFVDADPLLRGVVHRVRIDDHDGNRNKFELARMRFDRTVADGTFAFRVPTGARRIR